MPRLAPDMAAIFSAESDEYLSLLSEGFLELEQGSASAARLDGMFRAAHSLKGTSRVMGCDDLARAAHGLENVLDRVRQGTLVLERPQFDALSGVMDGLGRLLALTIEDGETALLADELLAAVGVCVAPPPARAGAPPLPVASPPPVVPLPPVVAAIDPSRPPPRPAVAPAPAMDVLKVPIARLDAIINHVGELLVAHERIQGYVDRCANLAEQLEEGSRRAAVGQARAWLDAPTREAQALAQALAAEEGRMSRLFQVLETAVHRTRMVPLNALFEHVPKWVRDLSSALGKPVHLDTTGGDLELDKRLVEALRDPLLHLVRNAMDHGIESAERRHGAGKDPQGLLRLEARRERGGISISLEDDGAGLDEAAVRARAVSRGMVDEREAETLASDKLGRFLLKPGFSTRQSVTEFSGRGVGLDVVAATVADLKGDVTVDSTPGHGCTVSMWVPPSLTTTRVLHVEVDGLVLGIPSLAVRHAVDLPPGAVRSLEGRPTVVVDGEPLLLAPLRSLLGEPSAKGMRQAVVVEAGGEQIALGVDALVGELEVLHKLMPTRLARLQPFIGVALLGDGRIMLLVDPGQLVSRARTGSRGERALSRASVETVRERTILLADDSLTTRVQLRRILEAGGYKVTPAVDGLEAWTRLGSQTFDAVVSDVQMPGLDGLGLVARIRATPSLAQLPVVLVTTLASEDDQRRGLEAGANAYITKGSFDQEQLLGHLRTLLQP